MRCGAVSTSLNSHCFIGRSSDVQERLLILPEAGKRPLFSIFRPLGRAKRSQIGCSRPGKGIKTLPWLRVAEALQDLSPARSGAATRCVAERSGLADCSCCCTSRTSRSLEASDVRAPHHPNRSPSSSCAHPGSPFDEVCVCSALGVASYRGRDLCD